MTEQRSRPPTFVEGDPRAPLAPRRQRRVLGRDPFEELGDDDPFLARLTRGEPARVEAVAPIDLASRQPRRLAPAPPPLQRRRLPRLAELGRAEAEAEAEGGVDPRRLDALAHLVEDGQGYDSFGLSPEALRRAFPVFHALYRFYFRVRSEGHENIPPEGPAILVANHGGLLPFDGAMGVVDILLHTDPPRLTRCLVDRFAGRLPFVNVLFARLGQVIGTRENFRELLRREELVWVFPEGIPGIRKPISQRYRLQSFHPGFVEEALRARVPIVPVAVVGADDQAPILYDIQPLARRLGLPVAPITPTFPWLGPLGLLPYPVGYRMVYGPPLRPADRLDPEAADDPRLVRYLASDVRRRIQHMVDAHRE